MKKMALSAAATTVLCAGLIGGCGVDGDDGATGDMRYMANDGGGQEQAPTTGQNRYRGEGPVTDMFTVDDRNRGQGLRGTTGQGQQRPTAQHHRNQGMMPGQTGEGLTPNETRQGGNVQGQTGDRPRMVGDEGTFNGNGNGNGNGDDDYGNDRKIASDIVDYVEEIDDVNDARVIVHEDEVLIGIDADDDASENLERKVEREAEEAFEEDKEVYVVTDDSQYDQLREMDHQLEAGAAFDEVGATFNEMIDDLADAAQRPFEQTRD
ncbi:YhcN/YlaJ family sporulation lipoprotein [Salsuginibacillus kocurii]|uniref:YhcN/YlaJ family sporulation lipoprotein n=1 Tax=Salsuginibacillus kocurii TaxID=427078 RepID=UPI000367EED2|nr:YhcN/YlaJ family sporulation lipoprotein [Salsuginibacillus kocurii]